MKPSAQSLYWLRPAAIALIAFAYFVVAVAALYFLNPQYTLIRSFTGNYDPGGHELLIASTFFSLGLGSLAVVIGLWQGMAPSARSRTGLLLFAIWGVGMWAAGIFPADDGGSTVPHRTTALLAGIFPVDVLATPETVFSFIHILAILVSLFSLSLAAIVLPRRFRQEERWRPIDRISWILAWVMIAACILLFLAISLIARAGWFSLSLNLLTFSSLLWLFLTAIRLGKAGRT